MNRNPLPTAKLGRTGIAATRLGYGAMELRDSNTKWPIEDPHAEQVLNTVLDEGINYIDTADCYGRSEDFIGRFLSRRRSEFTLATKCGCIPNGKLWTKENLQTGVERSLKRLQTDYIDVMQLHGASVREVEDGDLLDALEKMRDQGKVRWIGASTSSPNLGPFIDSGDFDVFQIPYSGFSRANENWISKAADADMGTIIRGGVAKGEPGEGKGKAEGWALWEKAVLDDLRAQDESRTAFMLRLSLSHPGIHTIIVGTQNPQHIRENVRTAQRGPLPSDVLMEAKRRLTSAGETPEQVG